MKNNLANKFTGAALAAVMALAGGCRSGLATSMVWRIGSYHPAADPQLRLSAPPDNGDVLVQYQECFAGATNARPRAYWLLAYELRKADGGEPPAPHFVDTKKIKGLLPVPQVCPANPPPTNGFSYCLQADRRSFEMWVSGALGRGYTLPEYSAAPPATAGRVALTPLAVATDTAIVAAILFCIGAGGGVGAGGR